jgi:FkbM family methyltransferase
MGSSDSRHVRGGSFLLRMLRRMTGSLGLSSEVRIHGIDGLIVVADFSDERILDVIHEIRGENPEYEVMKRLLGEGDTFIDVGANFGTFSLLAATLVGNAGQVIAIEPQRELARMIRGSIEASGLQNVDVIEGACGASDGSRPLFIPRGDSGRAGFFERFSARHHHSVEEVPIRTLDSIVKGAGITGRIVVKIDVEGSEMDVLEGARELIGEHHPPLLLEYNPWSAEAAGREPSDMLRQLAQLGYDRVVTVAQYLNPDQYAVVPLEKQSNLIATCSDAR